MTGLDFACTEVRAEPYAVGPTLLFRVRITAQGEPQRVHALALRCQFRIEPARRHYSEPEAQRLGDLFGERSRWGSTLHPLQFAQVGAVIPGFTGSTEVELPVPVSYDLDIAATRYCDALAEGEVPLLLLFSGTAFRGSGGFQVEPVPWDKEAVCRMPVPVWREAIDTHFPGCGWLRLPRDTMAALQAYRSRHALPSWEATVERLLSAAAEDDEDGAGGAALAAGVARSGTAFPTVPTVSAVSTVRTAEGSLG